MAAAPVVAVIDLARPSLITEQHSVSSLNALAYEARHAQSVSARLVMRTRDTPFGQRENMLLVPLADRTRKDP